MDFVSAAFAFRMGLSPVPSMFRVRFQKLSKSLLCAQIHRKLVMLRPQGHGLRRFLQEFDLVVEVRIGSSHILEMPHVAWECQCFQSCNNMSIHTVCLGMFVQEGSA